jgi:hypothetical protein
LANKYLNLAGIGRFTTDDAYVIPDEKSKKEKDQPVFKINFEQDITLKEDNELISFIAEHSGKMKSLAAADLDSHLELARQFLNIGKPFLLEGIGTLTKNKTGHLEFHQGQAQAEKLRDTSQAEIDNTSTTEDSFTDFEEMFSPKKPPVKTSRKIITWIIILASLAVAVWGGYIVYNKNSNKETTDDNQQQESQAETKIVNNPVIDTMQVKKPDSLTAPLPVTGTYRFIIETSGKARALKRFNDLKSYGLNIFLDTKDSLLFKIYFRLPATPADTARIRDSLNILYGTLGKGYVEQ